jgi:hypothetical protein
MNYSCNFYKARPIPSKVTKNPIVNIGKAITTIANPLVNALVQYY